METTQVQQLKLNVTNINSFLKKSNKKYIDLKKSNKAIVSQEVKKTKVKTKESKVEQRISPKTSPLAAVKKIASPSMSMFDKIINFGSILATGVFLNFLPAIKKKIDDFKKDNKEVIDNVVSTLTYVKNFGEDVANWLTEPEADHGFFSNIAEFDPHTGRITGGALKTVEDTFDGFGVLINKIDKAIGGKGTAGNAFLRDRSDEIAGVNVSKSNLEAQTETKSGMATFREDSAQNAALQEKVKARMQREKEQARNPGAASATGQVLSNANITPLQRQALGVLAKYESGAAGYNAVNQGGSNKGRTVLGYSGDITKMPQHGGRSLTDMTIGEIKKLQYDDGSMSMSQWISAGKLHAVGRYQFIGNTLPGVARRAGIPDSAKFNSNVQDLMALQLMKERGISPWVGPSDKATAEERRIVEQARKQPISYNMISTTTPKITPKTKDKDKQASVLNTTMGEEGSTTLVLMRQPILT